MPSLKIVIINSFSFENLFDSLISFLPKCTEASEKYHCRLALLTYSLLCDRHLAVGQPDLPSYPIHLQVHTRTFPGTHPVLQLEKGKGGPRYTSRLHIYTVITIKYVNKIDCKANWHIYPICNSMWSNTPPSPELIAFKSKYKSILMASTIVFIYRFK